LVIASLLGCFRTYTGIYYVARPPRAAMEYGDLATQVQDAIRPLGFRLARADETLVLFKADFEDMPVSVRGLKGADARVQVTVLLVRDPSVTVSDPDHVDETEFVRTVKERIAARLTEAYGIQQPRFERAFDWL